MRTIDDVADAIASELGTNSSDVIMRVLDCAKDVMRTIGVNFCCDVVKEEFSIKEGRDGMGRIRIPEKMLFPIIDIEIDGSETYQHTSSQKGIEKNSFYTTSREIVFPNIQNGKCDITYHAFYTDQDGSLLVGDIEYNAIFQHSMYELTKKQVSDRLKSNISLYRADAALAINDARGQYNAMNKTRTNYYLRGIHGAEKKGIRTVINIADRICKNC